MSIVIAIIALSVIIIIHELGHFIAARSVGIRVKEFSLFMGPKLISKEKNGTVYSIRAIPIGGFVNLEGEEEDVESTTSFSAKKPLEKIWVIAAGPLFNIAFALIALFLLFVFTGYSTDNQTIMMENMPAYESGLRNGDEIISIDGKKVYDPLDMTVLIYGNDGQSVLVEYERDEQLYTKEIIPFKDGGISYLINFQAVGDSLEVGGISEESDAYIEGLRVGDIITKLNDYPLSNRLELKEYMDINGETDVTVTFEREGVVNTIIVTPYVSDQPVYYNLGIYYDYTSVTIFEALKHAINFSIATIRSIYYSILWLITGVVSLTEIMGPVGIVTTLGNTVKQDTFKLVMMSLINMMAFISLNLGLMNLLPIPALDGSKIIIYAIEGIRGKKFNVARTAIVSLVGLVCLMALLLVTTYHDIARIFGW